MLSVRRIIPRWGSLVHRRSATVYNKEFEPEQRSELLKRFIKDKIKVSGPISLHEYMKLCSGSAAGYYTKKADIFGTKGDFVTSPELTQVFGELLGVWVYNELWNSGERGDWQLVELGPGTGSLMSDLERTLNILKVGKVDIVHVRSYFSCNCNLFRQNDWPFIWLKCQIISSINKNNFFVEKSLQTSSILIWFERIKLRMGYLLFGTERWIPFRNR